MEPVSHWRQHIGASEASVSFIRDHKDRKRPLSPESDSGGGNSTLDQWRGRKRSGYEDTHFKYVNTEPNRGPEILEQLGIETFEFLPDHHLQILDIGIR